MSRFYASSILRHEGKPDEAARQLEALAREHPDVSVIWIALGTTLGSLDREAEAAAALRKALAITPDSPAALRGLGRSLLALGDAPAAVEELRHASRLSPHEPYFRANLAEALFAAGDPDAGIAEYRESLRLSPERPWEIRHGLAARLASVGRMREAIEESRKVVAQAPAYAKGWMHLGLLLSRINENAEALEAFRKGLELLPDDADALMNVAEVASRLGRFAEARVAAEKALVVEPGRARAHFVLGRALEGLGDPAGAVASYETSTRLDPGYPEAWCNLGLRLRELGRFEEALPNLRRGHELGATRPTWRNPSAEWIAACERLIATDQAVDAVLGGESRPARLADWVAFARFCQTERGASDEASLLAKAMAEAEPEIAAKLRLQAVRSALRGAGLGSASSRPASRRQSAPASGTDRAASARRALAWLGEELSSIEASVAEGDRSAADARDAVGRWLKDADLKLLRDPAAAGLAEADAAAWRALRARIDAFLAEK
jgi:tetratricopeptide (TPR) repeat protein